MHDSARTRRLALVGVLAVVTALFGIAAPLPVTAQSSSSACGGPLVYFFDGNNSCNNPQPAFCEEPVAAGQVYDANSAGREACCAAEKESLGSCSAECAEQMYDFCAVVCCFAGEPDGYIAYGECAPGEYEADAQVNDFGEIDVELSCGSDTSSSVSFSSSSQSECGNGVVDEDEECDQGSWCMGGDLDSMPVYNQADADDCYDGGGSLYTEGGEGCDSYCNLEEIYCCDESGYRVPVDYDSLLSFAEEYAGDYLTGYYCAAVDYNLYPLSDSNLTTTNPEDSCFCGDGEVQAEFYEECDMGDGYNDDANGCPDCTVACGDGYHDPGAAVVDWGGTTLAYDEDQNALYEQCDDGNWISGDGCDEFCQMEPIYYCDSQTGYREEVPSDVRPEVDVGYECNASGDDPYLPDCFGIVTAGAYDSCECGDGVVQFQEDCDLGAGNNTLENGCNADCTYVCGDYVVNDAFVVNAAGDDWVYDESVQSGEYPRLIEQCDDGNYYNNDGCDENCQVEPGLCCFAPVDWEAYGYFEFEVDSITGEKVDDIYCSNYGGTYYGPDYLSNYRSGDYYDLCEVPGICCPYDDAPYETIDAEGCYGTFIDAASLAQGDYYGDSYDTDGDGSYNSEEASYACEEVGVCCYDVDFDGTNDTYDISTENFDVNADFCAYYEGQFIPLSAMEDPDAPGEECGIPGICCYTDYTYDSSTQVDCENYGDYVYDPYLGEYVYVTGQYVPFDEANTDGDYFLSQEEEIAACDVRGVCCYDDDLDGYFDTYDIEVSQGYCENWSGFYAPMGALEGQSPSEFCGIPGVCCYDNSEYYAGSDPDRQTESDCGYYGGEYHTYEEATTPPNGDDDYELSDQEMNSVCRPLGLCCHDVDGDQENDTYYEDMDSDECSSLFQGDWIANSVLQGLAQYPTPADYCRIPAVCCPTSSSEFTEPYYAQRYECTAAKGNFVDFDTANTDDNDVIDSDELVYACEAPGYCCNAYDYQYDEVYGADECESPDQFRPTAEAWDLNEDDYIEWAEACAQYCCYANSFDEYGTPYDLEPTNLAADYPEVYTFYGDDCQAATGDLNTLGYVAESADDVCAVYCCSEDEDGYREAYQVDDQYTPCADQYDDTFEPLTGGDYYGYPVFGEDNACDYDEPVTCCTANGVEVTFYENQLGEGDMCDEWLNEPDCADIEWRNSDYCYQAMAAVPASERQASSQSSLEPLCQLYCCSGGEAYGDPNLDPYTPCEDQEDDMGYQLYGGYNNYPTYDEYYACPYEPTYCCSGNEVVEAVDEYGNPMRDQYGNPIQPGDNCAEFGNFEDFPAHDEYTSDFACDYYCCDAETEEQVPVVADDYAEAQELYGTNYPDCSDVGELVGGDYLEGPVGTPESCSNPTLYCCEAGYDGPSGLAVPAYINGEDVTSGYDSNGEMISNGCYEPNPTRSYNDGSMTCCEGSVDVCSSSAFCTSISAFWGWVELTACNPQACAAAGCMPDLQDSSGIIDFMLTITNNPWYGGVACDTCSAGSLPTDDSALYACDYAGGYFEIDPEEYGYYFGEYLSDSADDAAFWCTVVYYDEFCTSFDILANAYLYPFFTSAYCN